MLIWIGVRIFDMHNSYSLRLCWAYIIVYQTYTVANGSSSVKTNVVGAAFQYVCPYNDFCTTNATETLKDNDTIPCCGPCSCESYCEARGNCCPDKYPSIDVSPSTTCEPSIVIGGNTNHKLEDYNGIHRGVNRYLVTRKCPETEKNKAVVRLCEESYMLPTFDDIAWVTDTETKEIYYNRYCAECNGRFSYEKWHLSTDCITLLLGRFYFRDIQSVLKHCSLSFLPPSISEANSNLCVIPDIVSCNSTGLWKTYNKTVDDFCNAHQLYYIKEKTIYKNVFCYMCNSASRTPDFRYDECQPLISSSMKGPYSQFTGILDPTVFERKSDDHRRHACEGDEVEDPLKVKCLKLTCPTLHAPDFGTCRKVTLQTYRFQIVSRYKLYIVWNQSKYGTFNESEYSFRQIGQKIRRIVHQQLGFTATKCGDCSDNLVFMSKKYWKLGNLWLPMYFGIQLRYHTTETCQDDFMTERIQTMDGKEIIIKFPRGEYILFKVQIDVNDPQESFDVIMPEISDKSCFYKSSVPYSILTRCPTVDLNSLHYELLINQTVTSAEQNLVDSLFDLGNTTFDVRSNTELSVSVCLDQYKATVAYFNNAPLPTIDVVFVVSLLFCICKV